MSILLSPFRFVSHYASPSAIGNATVSTASATSGLVKDAFSKTLGNAASTAGAHPYLTILGILGAAATGLVYSGRRPAMETIKESVYQGARKLKLIKEARPQTKKERARANFAAKKARAEALRPQKEVTPTPNTKKMQAKDKGQQEELLRQKEQANIRKLGAYNLHKAAKSFRIKNEQSMKSAPSPEIEAQRKSFRQRQRRETIAKQKCPANITPHQRTDWAKLYETLANDPKSIDYIMVVNYQKTNRHSILIRQHGYDGDRPETRDKLFSFYFNIPHNITPTKLYQGDHNEFKNALGITVPDDIKIEYLAHEDL